MIAHGVKNIVRLVEGDLNNFLYSTIMKFILGRAMKIRKKCSVKVDEILREINKTYGNLN